MYLGLAQMEWDQFMQRLSEHLNGRQEMADKKWQNIRFYKQ